jgi:hypothetical protein
MKKFYNLILMMLGFILACNTLSAQEEVLIKKTDWGDYTDIKYSILSDSIAIYMATATDKDVWFVLERNSIYFVAAEITNSDFHLRIKAEEGSGNLPLIMLKLNDDTGDWPNMFSTLSNVTFENIHITYEHGDKLKQYGHKINNFGGEGSKIIFKGCYLERERQAPIRLAASDMTVLIEDCRLGNVGERTSIDGNGRMFDARSNAADSVIIRNSTFYNISDRVFRTMGAHINYVEMDHITALNHLGRHGCIQLTSVGKAVIKNWLFIDPQMLGSGRSAMAEEHAKYDEWELQHYITLDSDFDNATELEIHHNNFANTQEVKDKWASIDSLEAPSLMNPLILEIMGDAADTAFLEPEVVEFANVPEMPYIIIDSIYAKYQPDDMNNSFGVYWHDTTVFIQNIDVSYASSYTSYTAAEGGFPLGDLNAFPNQKANWLAGLGPAASSAVNEVSVESDNLLECYPNPFKDETTINYSVEENAKVVVAIYSVNGQLVNMLVNQTQSAGDYSVRWNGTASSGELASTGAYLVVIHSGQKVDANYILFTK